MSARPVSFRPRRKALRALPQSVRLVVFSTSPFRGIPASLKASVAPAIASGSASGPRRVRLQEADCPCPNTVTGNGSGEVDRRLAVRAASRCAEFIRHYGAVVACSGARPCLRLARFTTPEDSSVPRQCRHAAAELLPAAAAFGAKMLNHLSPGACQPLVPAVKWPAQRTTRRRAMVHRYHLAPRFGHQAKPTAEEQSLSGQTVRRPRRSAERVEALEREWQRDETTRRRMIGNGSSGHVASRARRVVSRRDAVSRSDPRPVPSVRWFRPARSCAVPIGAGTRFRRLYSVRKFSATVSTPLPVRSGARRKHRRQRRARKPNMSRMTAGVARGFHGEEGGGNSRSIGFPNMIWVPHRAARSRNKRFGTPRSACWRRRGADGEGGCIDDRTSAGRSDGLGSRLRAASGVVVAPSSSE